MNIGFLIITYGHSYLDGCVQSIRQHYSYPIYIVDNNQSQNQKYHSEHKDINYEKNKENAFELGAIWHACQIFKNVDKFIILHNSMLLIDKLPIDIEKCEFLSFWKTLASDFSPIIPWAEKKLKEFNIILEHDKLWYGITGCCCIIDKKYLQMLIDKGYNKIYAKIKSEAVATEVLFGYLIENILKIENKSLYEDPIHSYVSGIKKYTCISKIAGGQGLIKCSQPINLSQISAFNKIFNIKFTNLNDYNMCYIDLINEIDKDQNLDIQNFLLESNTENAPLFFPNVVLSAVINSIRHRMFTKKYFPTYYQTEKQEILTHVKKLYLDI